MPDVRDAELTLAPIVQAIKSLKDRTKRQPKFRWGTITGTSPLRVRLDGDDQALAGKPATTAGGLATGQRVYVVTQNGAATIIGTASSPRILAGEVVVTPVANSWTGEDITFPAGFFTEPPQVVASAQTVATTVSNVSVSAITATGARVGIVRANTAPTTLRWIAIQP